MRELYATELRGDSTTDNFVASQLVHEWANRHQDNGLAGEREPATIDRETNTDGSQLLTLLQSNSSTETLWRSEVAIGRPGEPLHVTVRVRVAATTSGVIAPLDYEFGTPAIVRTLLREIGVFDAGHRIEPEARPVGASAVPDLVEWLKRVDRRLPVVVVSRTPTEGTTLLNTTRLARELAGVGHVRILASSLAGKRLTQEVSSHLGVWDGAVRVYFPSFTFEDDPWRHRAWYPTHVNDGLIGRLRSWLGTLSSSRTGQHPFYAQRHEERRHRLRTGTSDEEMLSLLWAELTELEEALGQRDRDIADLQSTNSAMEQRYEDTAAQLEDVRRNFSAMATEFARAQASSPESSPHADEITVTSAIADIERLLSSRYYNERIIVTRQALDGGRSFYQYQRPEELLRAVQAVMEAGALFHDDRLGEPPLEFFRRRGFDYASRPEPHLKADEATSPDQCLRIYWTVDTDARTWTVTHIGAHL